MTSHPVEDGGAAAATAHDLRRLEARIDARLHEIMARLVLHDGRFAAMGDRIDQSNRRADVLSERIDARLLSIDRRFDALDTRIDLTDARAGEARDQLTDALRDHNRAVSRTTLVGLALTCVTTAGLAILTVVLTL